jgi:hypothetical protein
LCFREITAAQVQIVKDKNDKTLRRSRVFWRYRTAVVGRTGRSRVRTVGVTFYNLESADSLQPPVIEHLKVASAQIADNPPFRIADHHGYNYFVDLGLDDGGRVGRGRLLPGRPERRRS